MTARLQLRRLSIHRGSKVFFDQKFQAGVNIIHGANGSGKSTIADFIYFALGGDLREWRPEARLAEYVIAEIAARDTVLTLRREVASESQRPMFIYFGEYEEAIAAGIQSWERFPYKRPEGSGYSFSQVIFKATGVPEAISDGLSNITMHQLLRVIYADQLTPIQKIFRPESFDTWQTRQAVGDVLCGVGGYDLYALQIFLRDLEKEYNETSGRLRGLILVASSYGDNVLAEHIELAIREANASRTKLSEQLSELLGRAEAAVSSKEADQLMQRQRRELSEARNNLSEIRDRAEVLDYEYKDADLFISHLRASIGDFEDSSTTFHALGAVRFEFCPSCFNPTDGGRHDPLVCHLCGRGVSEGSDESRTLAVRLDLEMQLSESLKLQEQRGEEIGKVKSALRAASVRLAAATSASELGRRSAASGFEVAISDVSRQIGRLEAELQTLDQRKALAAEIEELTSQKAALNARMEDLKSRIEAAELSQSRRKTISHTSVSERTKTILERDMPEHSDFGQVDSVQFDFADDRIMLNGVKDRVGSASGMVILKNSFLLGLFSASLADSQFGLPRFMLMDNVEDKGMVEERSWNFQRLIIEVSKATTEDHQFIYTTSKIAPELDGSDYVVGGKFTKERKTLAVG